jgi:oligopeptidase B
MFNLTKEGSMPTPPIAPKRQQVITQHGLSRSDDYFWMRYREDPAVMAYLKAENEYLDEMLAHTLPLQEQLFQEMKARIKEDDVSAPERRGDNYYYTRTEAGKQYPIYCRKVGSLYAPEEILIDQNALAEGKEFCRIGAFAISPDQEKLAYSIDPDGSEKCTIYIKNLVTQEHYPEQITNTYGDVYDHVGVAWANDSATLFYLTLDETLRPYQVHRHNLGEEPSNDVLIYHEIDDSYYLFLYKTRSQAYITTWSKSTTTSEWRYLTADHPLSELKVFAARRANVEYQIEHLGERFFVVTNDQAQNFKLMETSLEETDYTRWKEVIPNREDVLIEEAHAFNNYLVLMERKGGLKQIRISQADGASGVSYVSFPEPVYDLIPSTNPEYKRDTFRFTYSSLIRPNSVIDYHLDRAEWELVKQDEIPSGHDPLDYVTERLHATAPDGVSVPLSIVYRKGLEKNGAHPTLLYGYGSYGYSIDAGFNANHFSLINRGFIFAIAHIRGGSEMGRAWYDDGKMLNKRNTFTDFIACAEHLIAEGYTSNEKLAILGRSAGGLLVGACLTMRPDLYKAVVAKVPFVDVINTMSDPTIPLTTMEYDQWGNPDDRTYFDYMMSYSPYENIRPGPYPDVLVTTGLNDPRVAYWEPAKFTARLRCLAEPGNLILLKTNLDAGHAGASGRYDFLKEVAQDYAFLIDRLGKA